jgi:hypothetical protein
MASDWKVEALCDINKNLDQTVAMVQRVAG